MATETDPIVGGWYEDLDRAQKFEVLDVDEDRGIVEIQYDDGDISEIELTDWYDMELETVEDEGDWGDLPNGEDDTGFAETEENEEWSRPAPRKAKHSWDDEEDEDGADDWDEGYADDGKWDDD